MQLRLTINIGLFQKAGNKQGILPFCVCLVKKMEATVMRNFVKIHKYKLFSNVYPLQLTNKYINKYIQVCF